MKRLLLLSGILFFIGCATKEVETKKMATSVVDLMGNEKVVGWSEKNETTTNSKVVYKYKTLVKYKPIPIKDSDRDGIIDRLDRCPNTPRGLLVNHYGCPIITTLRINFDVNKVFVKKIYYPEIKKIALAMKANPKMRIEIDGYTDNIGSKEYNKKLSLERAEAVKKILVEIYGVNPKRIITKGFGEDYPLVPNSTETNRALNRRVEIIDITSKK